MTTKMPIKIFVTQLQEAVARKDGYIMGATGQDPKKWSATSWWYTQYNDNATQKKAALKWRETAQRVWDCNGLAEGLYKDYTGVDINTKARYNYSGWCSIKGTGLIPVSKRVPGAAVFWGSKASSISHVAYLEKPVIANKPEGDWYIIEARGVSYGVVRTKLNSRDPDFWGIMDKYFDYQSSEITSTPAYLLGERTLKKGMAGSDVSELQTWLTKFGYLNDKIDGEFGSKTKAAVEKFQKTCGLTTDGIYGKQSHAALKALIKKEEQAEKPKENPNQISITADSAKIYHGDTTSFKEIGTVSKNEKLIFVLNEKEEAMISQNGWYAVYYNDFIGWIDSKFVVK